MGWILFDDTAGAASDGDDAVVKWDSKNSTSNIWKLLNDEHRKRISRFIFFSTMNVIRNKKTAVYVLLDKN